MSLSVNESISGTTRDYNGAPGTGISEPHPDLKKMYEYGRTNNKLAAIELIKVSKVALVQLFDAYNRASPGYTSR